MPNIFDTWFSPSGCVKIPDKDGFDAEEFVINLNKRFAPISHTFENNVYKAVLRNGFFRYRYDLTVEISERQINFKFSNTNFLIILFTALLVGMFLFKGHVSTYIFWGTVSFFALYGANFFAVKNYLLSTLESVTKVAENEIPSPIISSVSITRQNVCPACGRFLTGFESACPECGLYLLGNSKPKESVSGLNDFGWRYYYIPDLPDK
ncbi:MAG: hypothetical protein J5826_05115 [Bacteroidales bacterium]|nr:hypothetical protein [Bacteroidales bacterium]